jgi:hypothetical protein
MNNNNNHETEFDYFGDQFDNDIDYNSKINTTMKANTILTRTNTYIEVESYKGEKRRIHLPKTIAKEAIYIVRGKIRMGEYQYNPKTDTWEKISRILLFLQSIVEAIRNIFSK